VSAEPDTGVAPDVGTTSRFSVAGKVAVVTGGGTGIGRGAALVLARHGADVVVAGRRAEPLAGTVAEIEALGRQALAVPTDVTSPEQCQQLVDTTLDRMGRLDILVNNAGGAETKSIMRWTEDEWHRVLALNLGSVWFLSRCAAEPMRAQGSGAIVNISSGAGQLAMPQAAVYGAAKAGVNNLTGSMAAAWTRKGVRVNAIAVGAVRAATLLDDAARYGLDPEAIGTTNASGRLGEPEEIGYGVLFFASDASSFCSGQTLYVHGGPGPAGV
jgi:NAD(P)-dependent dehydrogenase (short-subunit alcohol dehydrogenase family)